MEHSLGLALVERFNSWTKLSSCSSKTFLCASSSFLGAILAVYYLFPGYGGHQFLSRQVKIASGLVSLVRACICSLLPSLPGSDGGRTASLSVLTQDYHSLLDQVFRHKGLWIRHGTFLECPAHQDADRGPCLTTSDRNFVNDSDAIMFHARDIHVNDLPPPQWRKPHQSYVFFFYKSPTNTDVKMLRQPLFRNYFNRRDSDFVDVNPYGRMQCIDPVSPSCIEFPRTTKNSDVTHDHYNSTSVPANVDLTFKNRTIAWFVSNCKTNSRRELLARRLSQFIPVDIYGACKNGNNTCPDWHACDERLSRHYRFYLSFENSLCLDYVTEKLYRPLQYNAVPVVYGGADYSMYLPAGSYVNAMDFDSPQQLAAHLKKLMVDDELYLTFFRWKAKYVVKSNPKDGMCQLCHLLRHPEYKRYDDIAKWWAGGVNGKNRICHKSNKIRLKFS